MNTVVKILMERDGFTQAEAEAELQTARGMMEDCGYDPEECEDILCSELGLEMDYIFDVL